MFENENKDFSEHLITINRVAKVVKGGRRFGFAAIMIVGDNKGKVGYGTGKAKEVPEAVRKATEDAKTKMIRVHLKDNRTLHHDIVGRFGGWQSYFKISCTRDRNYCWRSDESII